MLKPQDMPAGSKELLSQAEGDKIRTRALASIPGGVELILRIKPNVHNLVLLSSDVALLRGK
jgi:hypothetical protein